jgi:RNA polymerase sigma-70 factor, ECF subfamily
MRTAAATATGTRPRAGLYLLEIEPHALSIDEERLIARAQSGDRAAFEELVRLYAERLHAVVLRLCANGHDAEEVTQEAFLRAWRAIDRFDGRSQFFTWLYRIGINEAKRHSKRRQRMRVVSIDEAPPGELTDPSDTLEARSRQSETRAALEAAVRSLPIDYRAPLVLRDIAGLSTSEAAEILGIREAAFKSRLYRARVSVRETVKHDLPGATGP